MHAMNDIHPHRTLGLHEWLIVLVLVFACAGVRAESVYKCIAADGAISYQATACENAQRATTIDIAPAPAFAPSPEYAVSKRAPQRLALARPAHAAHNKTEMAFECRGSSGEVFYRLGHCPHTVNGASSHIGASHNAKPVTVSGHPVTRDQACSEMRRAGAAGRKGHEFDEAISSYDRNLGNDPCK